MRLVFFGSGAFGVPTLRQLIQKHDVALVVTQPDRPAGRNRALTPTPIAEVATENGLTTLKPEDVNAPDLVEKIRSVNAEAFVVIAFGQKMGCPLLDGVFAINLHASLLPNYRGAAPINWAMINGERETGLSVITIADRMDAGDVLGQVRTAIVPGETAGELHDRLSFIGPELMLQVLDQQQAGTVKYHLQDERLVTKAPKLSKADGTVCFDQPAEAVRCRVHGLTPWPGCWVRIGDRPLRLHRVEVVRVEHGTNPAGTVLADMNIACGVGFAAIRLLEVQPPSGRLMTFQAYCNGHGVKVGERVVPL